MKQTLTYQSTLGFDHVVTSTKQWVPLFISFSGVAVAQLEGDPVEQIKKRYGSDEKIPAV